MNPRQIILLFPAVWMLFGATAAIAQTEDFDKFSLSLGVFITDQETDTKFDTSLGSISPDVDLENELGLDESNSVFRLDSYYRFAEKHQINFSIFDLSRKGTLQIQEEIEWNETVFPIDTVLTTEFDLAIYKLDYTWRFMQRDNGYLGLTAGLYVADIGFDLSTTNLDLFDRASVTAPLPVFGFRGEYDFSEKWVFRADAEVFFYEYEDYDGLLYDIYAGLEYNWFEHVGIGIGFNAMNMNVEVSKTNFSADLDWTYSGALLFLKFDF